MWLDPVATVSPTTIWLEPAAVCGQFRVKCTLQLLANNMYRVNVGRSVGRSSRHTIPYSKDEVDFFAIYLIPEDSWYIVSFEVVDQRVTLCIHTRTHPKVGLWLPYLEAWDLLRQTGDCIVLPAPEPNCPSPRRRRPAKRAPRNTVEEHSINETTLSLPQGPGEIGQSLAADDGLGIVQDERTGEIVVEELGGDGTSGG